MNSPTGFIPHGAVVVPMGQFPAAPELIANEAFFPLINTGDVRDSLRLDGTTTPTRVRDALLAAMGHVNNELRPWAAAQQAGGHTHLASVPAPQIGGESARVRAYLRAVYAAAAAHLEDNKRAQATMPAGLGKDARVLEAVGLRQDDHLQTMRHAIADVMQRMRETIELI